MSDDENTNVINYDTARIVTDEIPEHEHRSRLMTKTGAKLHARTDGGGTDFWAVSYADHALLVKALDAGHDGLERIEDRLHFRGKYVRPE